MARMRPHAGACGRMPNMAYWGGGLTGPPPPSFGPHGTERLRSGRGGEKGGRATIPPVKACAPPGRHAEGGGAPGDRGPGDWSAQGPALGARSHGAERSHGGARQRRQAKTGGKRGPAPMPPCFAEGGTPYSGVNGGTSEGRINRPMGTNRAHSSRRGIREQLAMPILSARSVHCG